MIARQLSVFLENKPGVLAAVCRALGDHDINIRGVSVSDTVDHAVVRLIVSDPHKAIHILGEHGTLVVETDVLVVKLSDHPGAGRSRRQIRPCQDQYRVCLRQLRRHRSHRFHARLGHQEGRGDSDAQEESEKITDVA